MNLSDDEKKLLEQYQVLSNSNPKFLNRLAVEIIPPIVFVCLGLYTGEIVWFLVLIVIMVTYNVQRVIRQYKNIERLRSISIKIIDTVNGKEVE
jgi:hypothetical protein